MNKEILNKFLTEMADLLKTAKDFTVAQVPEICKEVLRYSFFERLYWVLLGIVFVVISGVLIGIATREGKKNRSSEGITGAGAFIFGIIGLVVVIENVPDLIKIEFAPRLYLIEYLSHLIK